MAIADTHALLAGAEDPDAAPETVGTLLGELLASDPALGAATALGLLSREPRIKPSFGLLVDPGDSVLCRWRQRVAAGRALVDSPALATVFDEVCDELTDCADLAVDVLGSSTDIRPALSELLITRRAADRT